MEALHSSRKCGFLEYQVLQGISDTKTLTAGSSNLRQGTCLDTYSQCLASRLY